MNEITTNLATQKAVAPLAGLRVLDLGHTIMGPCAGLLLADLGADVIKIEPVEGDQTRRLPGFACGFFATFNRNKRSLAVNLKSEGGREIFDKLLPDADIVIENFSPGTAERLGCGWADVQRINPKIVYLSLKGFLAGPYEDRTALDEVVQMQSGLAYMTGPPGRPLRMGASVIDMMGGMFGVVAVLAALRERDLTGRGQRVGSSLFESAAFTLGTHITGAAMRGEPIQPMPARTSAWGIYDLFNTADGRQIFIGITSDAHWSRFCTAFELGDLLADTRLTTNAARAAERGWLIPQLQERLGGYTSAEIQQRADEASVPCAGVGRPEELGTNPHLMANGGLLDTLLKDGLMTGVPALPIEYGASRSRPGLTRQPPRIGEHSQEVLREAGFADDAIAAFARDGVIAQP